MVDDREPYEPLWATALKPPPRPVGQPAPPPPPPRARPPFPAGLALVATALFAALLIAAVLGTRSRDVLIGDVPSAWGDIPMSCSTTRIEGEQTTFELFRCRAVGGGALPVGDYFPPETTWSSDVDGRPALDHLIRIPPEGELAGWALYVP